MTNYYIKNSRLYDHSTFMIKITYIETIIQISFVKIKIDLQKKYYLSSYCGLIVAISLFYLIM